MLLELECTEDDEDEGSAEEDDDECTEDDEDEGSADDEELE